MLPVVSLDRHDAGPTHDRGLEAPQHLPTTCRLTSRQSIVLTEW